MDASDNKVIRRYLTVRGYDIVFPDYEGYIVAIDPDNNDLVIVYNDLIDRNEFERIILDIFENNDWVCEDRVVRFDMIGLLKVFENRALIRHHVDCLSKRR